MTNIFSSKTPEEVMLLVQKGLQTNHWVEDFCAFLDGEKTITYHNEDDVKKMSFMIPKGYFLSEEYMMDVLHNILNENVKIIAEWLLSKERKLTISSTIPVSIPIYSNGNQIMETNNVQVHLRKVAKNKLPYGFFVSSFQATK